MFRIIVIMLFVSNVSFADTTQDLQDLYTEARGSYQNFPLATKLLSKYLDHSKVNDCEACLAKGYFLLAWIENHHGQFVESIYSYHRSLAFYDDLDDEQMQSQVLENIGNIYYTNHLPSVAITYYQDALDLDVSSELPGLHYNMGLAYRAMEQYDQALIALDKAEYDKLKDRINRVNEIGITYYKLGEYSKAIGYYEYGLELCEKLENKAYNKSRLYNNIGNALLALNEVTKANKAFMKSVSIEHTGHKIYTVAYNNMARISLSRQDTTEAIRCLLRSLSVNSNQVQDMIYSLETLKSIAVAQNDYVLAYQYSNKLDSITLPLIKVQNQLSANEKMLQAQIAEKALKDERDKEQLWMISIYASWLFFILIVAFIISTIQLRKHRGKMHRISSLIHQVEV